MIRSLGLALVFVGVIRLKHLVQLAVLDRSRGYADWIAVIAMLAAGYALAFGARRWATPAALGYLAAVVAAWRWPDLVWPVAVLAAVWLGRRSYAKPAGRRAEAGGVLAVLGLTALLTMSLNGVALGVSATSTYRSGDLLAIWIGILGIELVAAWLAIRAARRLISGAPRPPLTALLLVMAAEVVAIAVASLFPPLLGDGSFRAIALLTLVFAIPLLTPLCLLAYARRAGPLDQPAAPDSAAAASAVAWLVLWHACTHVVGALRWHDASALAIDAVRAVAYLAVFAAWLRGNARATMWAAAIVGLAEVALFVAGAIVLGDFAVHVFAGVTRAMLPCTPLLVLAWLHRPSARDERGVASVFE